MTTDSYDSPEQTTTPKWQIAGLWALVTIPAAWGFFETVLKSVMLFTG